MNAGSGIVQGPGTCRTETTTRRHALAVHSEEFAFAEPSGYTVSN
jgi:hypothetical protein